MKTIKVLLVDDSAFIRRVISDILKDEKNIEVIGYARNGQEAVEKIISLKPDVVTMDVEMPIMNGIKALEIIMKTAPLPVIMLSSLTGEGTRETIKSLEIGAIDFIQKPDRSEIKILKSFREDVVRKINIAFNSKVIKFKKTQDYKEIKKESYISTGFKSDLVAIGVSTGGPRALQKVIPFIPESTKASFLVVQHMPAGFTKSLAERLNSISKVEVKEAEDGELIKNGVVYIAPGDRHLKVSIKLNKRYINLDNGDLVTGHKPSVDAMFQSISDNKIENIVAVIMTGMGTDGTKGLLEIKDNIKKVYSIGQNKETSVVYGMPKSAFEAGIIDHETDLENIIKSILKNVEVE